MIERVEKLGVDPETYIIELLIRETYLDPRDEVELHITLARRLLEEGKKILDKHPVQASEKLYKAVEECIKALAIYYSDKEEKLKEILERIKKRGRWTVTDLEKSVHVLTKYVGNILRTVWDSANYLHVWGFHEAKLDPEDIKVRLHDIEELVRKVEDMLRGGYVGSKSFLYTISR